MPPLRRMHARAAVAAVVFAACGSSASPPVEIARSTDVDVAPWCQFDVEAPEPLHGALAANDAPALDCVPPDGGARFTVGFAHAGWRLVATLPRSWHRVGDSVPLDAGGAALLYQGADAWCADWTGTIAWRGDLPDWSLAIDARCATADVRIAAAFSGHEPAPQR